MKAGIVEFVRTAFRKNHGKITLPVYNKPADCGGRCLFCIWEPGLTRSTTRNEDTLMAQAKEWHPTGQLGRRLEAYGLSLGEGLKYDIAVKGDSFCRHEPAYLSEYFRLIYGFFNQQPASSLEEAIASQADAPDRCVTVKVETRPDQIDEAWCSLLASFGVSTVELGVQSLDDRLLTINERGHPVATVRNATQLLKAHGFEVVYHMMCGMVGSSVALDIEVLRERLWEPGFCPDAIKLYPCLLLDNPRAQRRLWKYRHSPDWEPLDDTSYSRLLDEVIPHLPPYVHVNRVQRLIDPAQVVLGPRGPVNREKYSGHTACLWQRSVAQRRSDLHVDFSNYTVGAHRQDCGYSVEATTDDGGCVLGYGRIEVYGELAVIRDVRVLGDMLPVGSRDSEGLGVQHIGIGKALMRKMESIARREGCLGVLLRASPGTARYFERLGFQGGAGRTLRKQLGGSAQRGSSAA